MFLTSKQVVETSSRCLGLSTFTFLRHIDQPPLVGIFRVFASFFLLHLNDSVIRSGGSLAPAAVHSPVPGCRDASLPSSSRLGTYRPIRAPDSQLSATPLRD